MNNKDKISELKRIISIAQDDLFVLIKKGKRFKPENYELQLYLWPMRKHSREVGRSSSVVNRVGD